MFNDCHTSSMPILVVSQKMKFSQSAAENFTVKVSIFQQKIPGRRNIC
jgi:hypothetical protein